jgi:hypothetical protein
MDLFPANKPKIDSNGSKRPNDPIGLLRSRLKMLESELRFNKRPYPDKLIPFPWILTGRGFFPGGDGLWRDLIPPSAIKGPALHPFPFDGIMFVGQDFGSLQKYPPKDRPWELNNVATWKFLVKRIEESRIPGPCCFFTNALLGLREEGSTIGQNQCVSISEYSDLCRSLLAYQIEIQDPRLIVIFKSVNEAIYQSLFSQISTISNNPRISTYVCAGRKRVVLITQHPSSDHGVIFRYPDNYRSRCNALSEAWKHAQRF